ncbi:RluA family pseudouridine synthase [Candidatus Kuenenbacteria bacterium]|nr:RluA family pseudouridine synthase [Candidatus Kuenenbacteria bacterium]
MNEYIVNEKSAGERLDKFLTEKTEQTRSQIKRTILDGAILVNGKEAKVHQFLKLGDKVELQNVKIKMQNHISKINNQKNKPTLIERVKTFLTDDKSLQPKIIFKNNDYIILEKPAGLLVHATDTSTETTLVDWLINKFPEIQKVSDTVSLQKDDQTYRPGIVHRLDKDVAGLMLIARNQDAFDYFKQQFKLQKINKKYTALVHGQIEQDHDTIEFEISRSSQGKRMASHPKGSGKGRPAFTEFDVLDRTQKTTLVEITLHSGRTNQIRVHFMALGNPIVGDMVYKVSAFDNKKTTKPLLHATKLSFTDQQGTEQAFESELPSEFQAPL